MPIIDPRDGEQAGFQIFPIASYEGTLGDPEKILWSSIKYMCAYDIVDGVLYNIHGIKRSNTRSIISKNIKLYITQAFDLYEAANSAKGNTAPIFYYYSFLNLAKAICEIKTPRFHKTRESYRHGLSWKPSPDYLVKMERESISATTRGVWHVLLETILGTHARFPNPLKMRIKDLFSLCPGTSIEFQRTYHEEVRLIELEDPNIMINPDTKEVWIRFAVSRNNLKELNLSRPKFLSLITSKHIKYRQVRCSDTDNWLFESYQTKKCDIEGKCIHFELFEPEIEIMNLFAHLVFDEMIYSIPDQRKLPIRLPQILVLYTIMFWLGSLVRYDPHSVSDLQDSKYWVLIDGFLNQSRIWLLELFEWYLYKTETTLRYVR